MDSQQLLSFIVKNKTITFETHPRCREVRQQISKISDKPAKHPTELDFLEHLVFVIIGKGKIHIVEAYETGSIIKNDCYWLFKGGTRYTAKFQERKYHSNVII